ncbi:MAG: OmpH family outer membrane protein [Motiliproteus sp.]|nr:OmpH family outer membrane protein [Motiliproteus sp.]MCW9054067.1 OmpH family outer membrane protein [Motiliproteus sp.]
MKFVKLLLGAFLMAPMIAMAQNYAVLDIEGAISASKQAKAVKEQLQLQQAGQRHQLMALAEEGNGLNKKLEKEADFLSEGERKALLLQVQKKFQQFQELKLQLQQETQKQEKAFLQQLRPKVEEILKVIVEKNKIDLIFNKRALVYTAPLYDLTAQVVEELNKQ